MLFTDGSITCATFNAAITNSEQKKLVQSSLASGMSTAPLSRNLHIHNPSHSLQPNLTPTQPPVGGRRQIQGCDDILHTGIATNDAHYAGIAAC